jgi:hypothetical protein
MKLKIKSSIKIANQWIQNRPGKDSKGQEAPWCIIQKGTGKILSRHVTKELAEKAFKGMEWSKHSNMTEKVYVKVKMYGRMGEKISFFSLPLSIVKEVFETSEYDENNDAWAVYNDDIFKEWFLRAISEKQDDEGTDLTSQIEALIAGTGNLAIVFEELEYGAGRTKEEAKKAYDRATNEQEDWSQ